MEVAKRVGSAAKLVFGVGALVGGGALSSQAQQAIGKADGNLVLQHQGQMTFAIGGSTERTWRLASGAYLQDNNRHPISDQAEYRPDDLSRASDVALLSISWDWDAGRFKLETLEIRSRFGDSGRYNPRDPAHPARCSLQITAYAGGAVRGSGTCLPSDPDTWPVRFTFSATP